MTDYFTKKNLLIAIPIVTTIATVGTIFHAKKLYTQNKKNMNTLQKKTILTQEQILSKQNKAKIRAYSLLSPSELKFIQENSEFIALQERHLLFMQKSNKLSNSYSNKYGINQNVNLL